jgi:hypothetical protein
MRAWSISGVCGRVFVALVLTVPGLVDAGRYAQAQDAARPSGEPNPVQSVPISPPSGWKAPEGSDRVAVERLFGDSERLTRGIEPKRMQTIRVKPDGADVPAGMLR